LKKPTVYAVREPHATAGGATRPHATPRRVEPRRSGRLIRARTGGRRDCSTRRSRRSRPTRGPCAHRLAPHARSAAQRSGPTRGDLRNSHSESVLYGVCVRARRALNIPERRFPLRAVSAAAARGSVVGCGRASLLADLDTSHPAPSRSIGHPLICTPTNMGADLLDELLKERLLLRRHLCEEGVRSAEKC
jgi:hypothetical protein